MECWYVMKLEFKIWNLNFHRSFMKKVFISPLRREFWILRDNKIILYLHRPFARASLPIWMKFVMLILYLNSYRHFLSNCEQRLLRAWNLMFAGSKALGKKSSFDSLGLTEKWFGTLFELSFCWPWTCSKNYKSSKVCDKEHAMKMFAGHLSRLSRYF